MTTTLDLTGLDKVRDGFARMVNPDATDLMLSWMIIIDADNRQGILHGLDGNGVSMTPVTYRPKPPGPMKPTKSQRGGAKGNVRKGGFLGLTSANMGNLTSAEYRRLGGPPLAPRGQFSRVITNLRTGHGRTGPANTQWEAFGYWEEVVSTKGVPFLRFHFDRIGQKRRDLRGVRPDGVRKAVAALGNWARLLIRQVFGRGGP